MGLFETSFDEQIALIGLIVVCLKMAFDKKLNLTSGYMTSNGLNTILKLGGLIIMVLSFMLILNHYKWYGAILVYIINFFIAMVIATIIVRFLGNKTLFLISSIMIIVLAIYQSILIF
ncbi:MAG: hypothetical protein IE891_01040 [Flavobacteriaceae bacterium]|nr:hypothetical protein [Flavobacteriaceae bacterium]